MKVSRYVQIIEEQLHTLLGLDNDGGLLVVSDGRLPREAQQTLAGYAPQLIQYLTTGVDVELNVRLMQSELESFGFMQLETGAWTHPEGNGVGDRIIAGVISAAAARGETKERERRWQRQAHAFGARPTSLPPLEDVEELTQHDDGSLSWVQRRGHRYKDPAPRVARIDI